MKSERYFTEQVEFKVALAPVERQQTTIAKAKTITGDAILLRIVCETLALYLLMISKLRVRELETDSWELRIDFSGLASKLVKSSTRPAHPGS